MSEQQTVCVGDWVRFYQMGKLVIGQVEYVTKERGNTYANTDIGAVNTDWIQEVRKP